MFQVINDAEKSIDAKLYIDDILSKVCSNRTYIFGAGDRAQWLGKFLLEQGIEFEGFLVNRRYYNPNVKADMYGYEKKIFCLEDKYDLVQGSTILLGLSRSLIDERIFDEYNVREVISINIGNRLDYIISKSTIIEHQKELERVIAMLDDDYSKECFRACILGRMTAQDIPFTPSEWSDPEYFFDEDMKWSDEVIIDCGAYIGDTVDEFINKANKKGCNNYKIYAFEPDRNTYLTLSTTYKDKENVFTMNKATYATNTLIDFNNCGGEMSSINCSDKPSDNLIETIAIDSFLGEEKATFIKMDVEGCELESLKGAANQIKKNCPILAICIYHKVEDLWEIPLYIQSIQPKYRFKIRTHSSMPTELVLFCSVEK